MDDETLKQYYEIYAEFWQIFKRAVKSDKPVTEVYRQANIEADVIYQRYRAMDQVFILDMYKALADALVKVKEDYRCSVCGRKLIGYSTETLSEAPFCHCGARMIEPQERSDKE